MLGQDLYSPPRRDLPGWSYAAPRTWCAAVAIMLLAAVPGPAKAASRSSDPAYLCDGRLAPASGSEEITQAVVTAATLGVVGILFPFADDNPQPARGKDGIAACDQASAMATHPVKRAELRLARAIHHLETRDYEAALADARSASALAGEHAQEPGYRRTMGVAQLNVEAVALYGLNRWLEAEDVALRMAAAAPWNLRVQRRATELLSFSRPLAAADRAFFERAGRLNPQFRVLYGIWLELDGDFRGAERMARLGTIGEEALDPSTRNPAALAARAFHLALAGDRSASDALAAEAMNVLAPSSGLKVPSRVRALAKEELALRDIVVLAEDGQAHAARDAFRKGRWSRVPSSSMIAVVNILRRDAPPEALGWMAQNPAEVRAIWWKQRREVVTSDAEVFKLFWWLAYEPPGAYQSIVARVWSTDPALFRPGPGAASRQVGGELYTLEGFPHDLGVQALLLHAAVVAKSRGLDGLTLGPISAESDPSIWVAFGKFGTPAFPAESTLLADDVIAALSPQMPKPIVP